MDTRPSLIANLQDTMDRITHLGGAGMGHAGAGGGGTSSAVTLVAPSTDTVLAANLPHVTQLRSGSHPNAGDLKAQCQGTTKRTIAVWVILGLVVLALVAGGVTYYVMFYKRQQAREREQVEHVRRMQEAAEESRRQTVLRLQAAAAAEEAAAAAAAAAAASAPSHGHYAPVSMPVSIPVVIPMPAPVPPPAAPTTPGVASAQEDILRTLRERQAPQEPLVTSHRVEVVPDDGGVTQGDIEAVRQGVQKAISANQAYAGHARHVQHDSAVLLNTAATGGYSTLDPRLPPAAETLLNTPVDRHPTAESTAI